MSSIKIKFLILILLSVFMVIPSNAQIPPTPANFLNTTGNFWINWTWKAGSGNITNLYNISQNGTWDNETANNWTNVTVKPHGWSNISVCAYNSTGLGNWSSCWDGTKQVPNNAPVQTAIGAQSVTEDSVLTITISSTDADSDTITYSTDAIYGTLASNVFTWTPPIGTVGTYSWYFTTTDNQTPAGTDTETVTITVIEYVASGSGYVPPDRVPGGGGGGAPAPISTPISPISAAIPAPASIVSETDTGTESASLLPYIAGFIVVVVIVAWSVVYYKPKPKSKTRSRR